MSGKLEGDTLKTEISITRTVTTMHEVIRSANGRRKEGVNMKDMKQECTDYAV